MEPIYKTVESLDWMTLVLFFSLLILTLGKYLFQSRFLNFMILPFNNKYVVLYNKKGRLLNWFHILLTVFQLINLSLFLFLVQKTFFPVSSEDYLYYFFLITGWLLLFELVKMMLQLGKGFVFNTQGLVSDLLFNKTSYLNHSSLVMFVANMVLVYIAKDSQIVIYAALVLIVSINIIGFFRLMKNHQKVIISHFFYFILYLCTLEIAPLVIVGSYLKD
ncbi:DUF4271 domain-containing protein [Flagellimonas myxillae]|uniref:DUF4271 domain-containing protein n=1 Tax=Flagellimonas myxillae TaxID=2942214 RepID=UPI00201FA5AC|nr:DUF4271 domain-containing protein [Muricauda myxillae]MCL6267555.1 DUF4271 domain-containing protein [Muricauda myxillae]